MSVRNEGDRRSEDPVAERIGGDEVAGEERSERVSRGLTSRGTRRRTARTVSPEDAARIASFTGEQRLLLLDAWLRSKLPARDFAPLVGVTATTLYAWRKRFEAQGPAALLGTKRRRQGSRLPEPTRRAILMMKQAHPDWGQDRIHDMLLRGEGLEASAGAVQRVLLALSARYPHLMRGLFDRLGTQVSLAQQPLPSFFRGNEPRDMGPFMREEWQRLLADLDAVLPEPPEVSDLSGLLIDQVRAFSFVGEIGREPGEEA
jgi:transposase